MSQNYILQGEGRGAILTRLQNDKVSIKVANFQYYMALVLGGVYMNPD